MDDHWNYRVGHDKKTNTFAIYSVYYNSEGTIMGMSVEPERVESYSVEQLRTDLQLMLEALDEPVLEVSSSSDDAEE